MMHYGAETPKRSHGYSNNKATVLLDKGVLGRAERIAKTKRKLVKHDSDQSTGKKKWTGLPKHLKDSQSSPQV